MQKLNPGRFGFAAAGATLIVWVVCSILVFALGRMMMDMTGYMMHGEFSGMNWSMSMSGVLYGGAAWVIAVGITGWLIALLYNALGGSST